MSCRLRTTEAIPSRRLSPTLPFTSSTWSTRLATSPYCWISLVAVFSPRPGMPGRLSDGSPRSAANSGYCAGRQPVLLLDRSRRHPAHVADTTRVVEDGDPLVDQLERVAVAGDDQDVHAVRRGLGGEGRDDVIGLEALGAHDRDAQRVQHLADQRHLALEVGGGLGPASLVVGVGVVPEVAARDVEAHRDVGWCLVAQDVDEHRREAVDGVGRLPVGGAEVLDRAGRRRRGRPVSARRAAAASGVPVLPRSRAQSRSGG